MVKVKTSGVECTRALIEPPIVDAGISDRELPQQLGGHRLPLDDHVTRSLCAAI
jgi:hypothetical protein